MRATPLQVGTREGGGCPRALSSSKDSWLSECAPPHPESAPQAEEPTPGPSGGSQERGGWCGSPGKPQPPPPGWQAGALPAPCPLGRKVTAHTTGRPALLLPFAQPSSEVARPGCPLPPTSSRLALPPSVFTQPTLERQGSHWKGPIGEHTQALHLSGELGRVCAKPNPRPAAASKCTELTPEPPPLINLGGAERPPQWSSCPAALPWVGSSSSVLWHPEWALPPRCRAEGWGRREEGQGWWGGGRLLGHTKVTLPPPPPARIGGPSDNQLFRRKPGKLPPPHVQKQPSWPLSP